jgi:hypothetical protein
MLSRIHHEGLCFGFCQKPIRREIIWGSLSGAAQKDEVVMLL